MNNSTKTTQTRNTNPLLNTTTVNPVPQHPAQGTNKTADSDALGGKNIAKDPVVYNSGRRG